MTEKEQDEIEAPIGESFEDMGIDDGYDDFEDVQILVPGKGFVRSK